MKDESVCVIDGDLISFKAAAACETRFINVKHTKSGKVKQFPNRTNFKEWLKENTKWQALDFTIEDDRTVDPVENCLHTIKVMLDKIHKASKCKKMIVVVQGDGNFRDNIPLPTKYKGGRQDTLRPALLPDARNYLIKKYKAELAHGRESDDVLASYAYKGFKEGKRIVQCTIDKDARQCEGWLFDWEKMEEPEYISGIGDLYLDDKGKLKGNGRKWLYYQATVGDPSDSYNPSQIAGKKYGEKTFYKDFATLTTDKECWEKMVEIYKGWYPDTVKFTNWEGNEQECEYYHIMQMYFDCAFMQRWEGDRIQVKDVLEKMGLLNGNTQ